MQEKNLLDPKSLSDDELKIYNNEYQRRYRIKNPDKAREALKRYWKKQIDGIWHDPKKE